MNLIKAGGVAMSGSNLLLGKHKHIARRVNAGFSFAKSAIISGILLIISIFLFIVMVWPIAFFLLFISVIIFIPSYITFKRTNNVARWTKGLKESISPEEKIIYFAAPITDAGIKDENQRIRENTLIITDKRIIFIYIPLFDIRDLFDGNPLKAIGKMFSYEAYQNKVKERLDEEGLTGIINLSNYCFSVLFQEIKEVKINNFWGKLKFVTEKGKFNYSIRRNKLEEMRSVLKNYIKQ